MDASIYSSFLNLAQGQQVWWPLPIAIQLGAGYRPSSKEMDTLRAPSNIAKAAERTLVRAVGMELDDLPSPAMFRRDGVEYVAAEPFLQWLAKYTILTRFDSPFPTELARAVNDAEAAARGYQPFIYLGAKLKRCFDLDFDDLPVELQVAIKDAVFPFSWDGLGTEQRRSVIHQWEIQHDPAREGERKLWWDLYIQKSELEKKIKEWGNTVAKTASELATKEARLESLNQELIALDAKMDALPNLVEPEVSAKTDAYGPAGAKYIPYAEAFRRLNARHQTSPEEIGGWIFLDPRHGGLSAFVCANELDPPPRFHFALWEDFDYVSQLMRTWFLESEIARFEANVRFITYGQLVERWKSSPGIRVMPFIQAKVEESRLQDFHPSHGATEWGLVGAGALPPRETALFRRSDVAAIEQKDFAGDGDRSAAFGEDGSSRRNSPTNFPRVHERNAKLQQAANELAGRLISEGRKDISKREISRLLKETVEWQDLTAETVTRILRVEWPISG